MRISAIAGIELALYLTDSVFLLPGESPNCRDMWASLMRSRSC
jgi:hypothetical protein